MITVAPACAGRQTRERHETSYRLAARSLGRREVRRQHPRCGANRGDFDGEAGPPTPDGRHRGDDCDSRRNPVAGAATGSGPAEGLGDIGRPVVPVGIPGGTHRDHRLPVPADRLHPGVRTVVRAVARDLDRGRREHRQRASRSAVGPRRGLAAGPPRAPSPDQDARCPPPSARLADGDVDAV